MAVVGCASSSVSCWVSDIVVSKGCAFSVNGWVSDIVVSKLSDFLFIKGEKCVQFFVSTRVSRVSTRVYVVYEV